MKTTYDIAASGRRATITNDSVIITVSQFLDYHQPPEFNLPLVTLEDESYFFNELADLQAVLTAAVQIATDWDKDSGKEWQPDLEQSI